MPLLFNKLPGYYESQIKRRYQNKLLKTDKNITQDDVNAAHQQDLQEIEQFRNDFTELMNRAIELEEKSESDVILQLKEDIDKLYEHCCGLAGDTSAYKKGLKKLMKVVMQAVWQGAGNDPTAHEELTQEEVARAQHYELLDIPLIPHLLRPDSQIQPEELVGVILGEEVEHAQHILSLFDHEHLVDLQKQAETLLAEHDGAVHGAPFAGSIAALLKEQAQATTHH